MAARERFTFGRNWAGYADSISDRHVDCARTDLQRLLGLSSLAGRTFVDLGCGSGIHALAALQLGAGFVHAIDIDPECVRTARSVISKRWDAGNYRVDTRDLLESSPRDLGRFDVVYSWGVLHHTGDVWCALDRASRLVAADGLLALALYRWIPLAGFWRWEKRRFSDAGPIFRAAAFAGLVAGKAVKDLTRLRNPVRRIREHRLRHRGMDFATDVVDWLGGYPYEAVAPAEVRRFAEGMGFELVHWFKTERSRRLGILGAGNAEYLFRRL